MADSDRTSDDKRARATRAKLIRAARRHFAVHGFEGSSVREIQRIAGVNPAAVHYHFGSKEGLYRAVIDASLSHIQAERIAAFNAIDPDLSGEARLMALLRAYAAPHIRLAASVEGRGYSQVLIQVSFTSRESPLELIRESYAPTRTMFLDAICALFPDVDRVEVARCMAAFITAMMCNPVSVAFAQMAEKRPFEDDTETWIAFVTRNAAAAFAALPRSPD